MKVVVTNTYELTRLDPIEMVEGPPIDNTDLERAERLLGNGLVREARRYAQVELHSVSVTHYHEEE